MTGKLYIVATPIGNLEDITFRAIKVLNEVDLILAEDTRVTSKLLSRYNINKPLQSYHQHSLLAKGQLISQFLLKGTNIALVTDAGTPGISDPGNELINFLLESISINQIIPVPGASSLVSTLSICGFNVNRFIFLGFMPKKGRTKLFDWLKTSKTSFVFFDSPHRVIKSLAEVEKYFGGEIRVLVARELTKLHETLYRGSVVEVLNELRKASVKGEVVVVVEL